MSTQTFTFDRDFQIGTLALMQASFEFNLMAVELIEPQYYEERELAWVFQTMRDYWQDHNTRCDFLVLHNELRKAVTAGRVKAQDEVKYTDIFTAMKTPPDADKYVLSEVVRFCRRQAVRKTMLECAPMVDSQDADVWDNILGRMTVACNTGAHAVDIGMQYFLQYPDRLRARLMGEEMLVIPTGITELDYKIGGGLKAGQLGLWLGGTGAGKSIALPHCGKRAVFGGWKVVHYTLELSGEVIAERYDSAWSQVPVHDLAKHTLRVEQRLGQLHSRHGNSLIIKEYPTGQATVNTLRQHLQALKHIGFVPDLIVVDYVDLLKPLTNYNDEYADLGGITRDLRGLAGELKIPIWSATQVNRPGMSSEVVDVEHIADSFRKAQIADVIVAICASREELEMDVLRLFLAKNRNGPSKHTVKIRSAYNRMCFYDPVAPPPPTMPSPKNGGGPAPGMPKTTTRQPKSQATT
jgi:replicative DNA helicase